VNKLVKILKNNGKKKIEKNEEKTEKKQKKNRMGEQQ